MDRGRPRRVAQTPRPLGAVAFDQYPLWLETIARVAESAGFEIVGSSTEASDAIAMLERERPRLFLLGLERAAVGRDDAEALFEAASRVEGVATIVVSNDDDPEYIETCLLRGATTYVLKTIRPEDLSATIRQAVDRRVYLFGAPRRRRASTRHKLTPRELEVLSLVAEGLANAEVARRLWISVATVKFHLAKTYEKVGVTNRTGAVRWAQQNGLLGVEVSAVPAPRPSRSPNGRAWRGGHSLSRS